MNDETTNDFLQSVNKMIEENKKLKEQNTQLKEKCSNLNETIKQQAEKIKSLSSKRPTYLEIGKPDGEIVNLGLCHHTLEKVLNALRCRMNVYLYGPSGSGKTFAAQQCAEALGVNLYSTGAISDEYKLTGFMNAMGNIVSTEFRKAYEDGGLFLFDEIDGSFPQAVLAFNAALANDYMDFPDKRVKKHENFYCIAAANTIGQGANRQYVGRNQLDAASLDRFVFIYWDYDLKMERELAGDDEWFERVLKVRNAIDKLNIRHIISPRASLFGSRLLKNKFSKEDVENMVLWKGVDATIVDQIKEYIKPIEVQSDYEGKARFGEIKSRYERIICKSINIRTSFPVKKDQPVLNILDDDIDYSHSIIAPIDGIITYKIKAGDSIKKGDIVATIERV